jgi:hypothetical protein
MCNFRFVSLFESGGDQPLGFLDRTGPYWIVSARVTRKTHKVRDLQNTLTSQPFLPAFNARCGRFPLLVWCPKGLRG